MNKFFHLLYQPYKWLFFIPFLAINTLILAAIAVFLSFINPKLSHFTGVFWARINSFFTPMFVEITGKEHINKNTSYIIVANHQSYYDILLIYAHIGIDFKWVMKQELRKVPGLGIACEKIGHIFIDRANRKNSLNTLNKIKAKLVNGTSVIIFPEGTRSQNGQLSSFKRGAFSLAFDLKLSLLPITLIGTGEILPPNSLNITPGKAKMIIHPGVNINNYKVENINYLIKDVESIISEPMKRIKE
jgi:1-acyl-sn-glycerol-3-phosphate acyltransferase